MVYTIQNSKWLIGRSEKMDKERRYITVDEALEYIMSHIERLDDEQAPLLEALDCILAEDIVSQQDIPPFTNSAMDGYAVRAADTAGAGAESPLALQVVADLAAGETTQVEVGAGEAVRIMTGAPLPEGADAVVRFEDTDERHRPARVASGQVLIYVQARPGDNVRRAGEDIRRGQVVLRAGRLIRPQEVGVLASLGHPTVRVIRRPRVAILATGDELLEVTEPLAPGKIRSSNEYTNAGLVRRYGGVPLRLGIARDDVAELTAKIRQGLAEGVDLFITSAGVSVGDYDMVKNVLAAEGEMHFWQVRIKPGKPLAFGTVSGVPLIGLPGNPVAAMVAFETFARPAILKMAGWTSWEKPTVRAILEEDVTSSGRRHYMRARVYKDGDRYRVTVRGSGVEVQGSGILSSMVWANAFLVVVEDVTDLPAGTEVDVQMLDWPGVVF
jgi:molybdopterin molybdotransferase